MTEKQPDLSMASLREMLFETMIGVRDGKVSPDKAVEVARLANCILKSAEVQLTFERLRLDSKAPARLPAMALDRPSLTRVRDEEAA